MKTRKIEKLGNGVTLARRRPSGDGNTFTEIRDAVCFRESFMRRCLLPPAGDCRIAAAAGADAARRRRRPQPGQAQTPEQFFGFRIGTDGELARYPKILEYLQHLSKTTNRVKYQELGKTTMGNPYVLATVSAPENLAKLDRLVAINRGSPIRAA